MRKILYIAPENVVGNLNLWQKIHRSRGNECRYITYFPSVFGFPDDICLNLPLVAPQLWFLKFRKWIYSRDGGPDPTVELDGIPPIWQPGSRLISTFFKGRDRLWRYWVEPAIQHYNLLDFDIIHLETGLEFYRNGSFVQRAVDRGIPVLNTFHGIELRHRGVIPAIDEHIRMNFTSELDLLIRHPKIRYLFLPADLHQFRPNNELHDPITICHATRNRHFKGSDQIIAVGRKLEEEMGIRFLLIENCSHDETLRLKQQADIYIDQITNVAPGYGMNSIEAMAMGQVCCANIDTEYQAFLPDHPFVHVTPESLETKLRELLADPKNLGRLAQRSKNWVGQRHSLQAVGDQLYQYYQELQV